MSPPIPGPRYISRIDLQADYLEFLQKKIDFDVIRRSGIKVGVDLLFGTSREYLDEILERNGIPIEEIHGYVDPYFGGVIPSCTEENLRELKRLVRDKKCDLGVATDADGDRFGILDQAGDFIHQNIILATLLDYLVVAKGWRGGVARSVTTTRLIDRIARRHGLEVHKTPVGFKYMADLFLQGKIIFGGEESACIAVKDHLPEKDGIFAGLLVSEMIAASGRSLSEIRKALFREYGDTCRRPEDPPADAGPGEAARRSSWRTRRPRWATKKVEAVETKDGIKLEFADDAWLLLRFSGTEPRHPLLCRGGVVQRARTTCSTAAWSSFREGRGRGKTNGSVRGKIFSRLRGILRPRDARDVLLREKGLYGHRQDPEVPPGPGSRIQGARREEEPARDRDPRARR